MATFNVDFSGGAGAPAGWTQRGATNVVQDGSGVARAAGQSAQAVATLDAADGSLSADVTVLIAESLPGSDNSYAGPATRWSGSGGTGAGYTHDPQVGGSSIPVNDFSGGSYQSTLHSFDISPAIVENGDQVRMVVDDHATQPTFHAYFKKGAAAWTDLGTWQQTSGTARTGTAHGISIYTDPVTTSVGVDSATLVTPDTATIEQEGFRWRNDDGDEDGATWAAAQDTDISAPVSENRRLRVLLNATDDPGSTQFQLEYRLSGGTFSKVLAAQPTAALSFGAAGTVFYPAAANPTSLTPAYPSGITTRSKLILLIGMKPATANGGSVTTPTGWTARGSLTGAGGYGSTLGADTGNTNVYAFEKDTTTGSESGTLSVTVSDCNVAWAVIIRVQSDVDVASWSLVSATGSDTSAGAVSVAFGSDPGVQAGDLVLTAMVIPTDVTTPAQFSAEGLSQAGVTFGAVTEAAEFDTTIGNDLGGFLCHALATAGTSSAAPTLTATAGGTTTNVRGPAIFLRIRATAAQQAILLSPSANITAGGEATIAQLAAPSGKTTSDFTVGRMQDDENPADAVDISADDYTEMEWCLTAVSGVAAVGEEYDFRVTKAGTALDSYTVTPSWTIGSSGGGGGPTYTLAVTAAALALDGQGVGLRAGRYLPVAPSALELAGQPVTMEHSVWVDPAEVVITPGTVDLVRGKRLTVDAAAAVVTPQPVGLYAGRRLEIALAAVELQGAPASLRYGRRLPVAPAVVEILGEVVELLTGRRLGVAAAAVELQGKAVGLIYTPAGGPDYTLPVEAGALVLAGGAVGLRASRWLPAAPAAITISGENVGLSKGIRLAVDPGALELSGGVIGLRLFRRLIVAPAHLEFEGQEVVLRWSGEISLVIISRALHFARTLERPLPFPREIIRPLRFP